MFENFFLQNINLNCEFYHFNCRDSYEKVYFVISAMVKFCHLTFFNWLTKFMK